MPLCSFRLTVSFRSSVSSVVCSASRHSRLPCLRVAADSLQETFMYRVSMVLRLITGLLAAVLIFQCTPAGVVCAAPEMKKPNIVYILADDLGIGDVRAFNPNSQIRTPHLDQLASEGMRFTDAHSGSSVCTPTRYGVLTGRYAWRTRLQSGVCWGYSVPLITAGRMTVASLLKQQGYSTACVGKWHLGLKFKVLRELHSLCMHTLMKNVCTC